MKPAAANLMIILDSSVTYNALQVDAERQCLSSFFSWNKDATFKCGFQTKRNTFANVSKHLSTLSKHLKTGTDNNLPGPL